MGKERKIRAVESPDVVVKKIVSGYTESPSLERYVIEVYDADSEAHDFGAGDAGLICEASVVVFDPKKGNVAIEADAESGELVEVASAYYGSMGQGLSPRRGSMAKPCL